MNPSLLIVVQSIVLPLSLSSLLLWLTPHKDVYKVPGNILIWLSAYAWIIQWPEFPPGEAVDWLWLLLAASALAGCIANRRAQWFFRSAVFLTALVAIAWPVLHYQPSLALLSELVIVTIAAGVLFNRGEQIQTVTPALNLTIQATGLAMASALSGSLLIGQLSIALAAVTAASAIVEIPGRLHTTPFSTQQQSGFLALYLCLLTITRLYVELPPVMTSLLLISPIISVLAPWRHNWVISLLLSFGAVGSMLSNSDSTAYY